MDDFDSFSDVVQRHYSQEPSDDSFSTRKERIKRSGVMAALISLISYAIGYVIGDMSIFFIGVMLSCFLVAIEFVF